MVRAHIKGVFPTYKMMRDGSRKTYWYHRATGKRLRGQPGSSEFISDFALAESTMSSRTAGTLAGLIRAYTLSEEFEKLLAENTRHQYRRMLTKAEQDLGDLPQKALNDPRVRKDFLDWREKIARSSGSREADHRLSAVSAMISWAIDRGHVTSNHVRGFKRLYHADRSEQIWLPEHIEAFMKVAPLEMQRALIIALHTGQRQADILKLPWSSYDGQTITLRQGKASRRGVRAAPITLRCTAALSKMLDELPRSSPIILTTKTGRPYKKRYFASQWKSATEAAEITDLHFNDLRGTAVTLLSEAGNTVQQVASVTGHSLKTVTSILEKYLARTRGLSDAAIMNFENSPRTDFANQLQTSAPKGKTKNDKS
ncbi:tyrosine-type recombinase/integrase [Bradyrhizobium sp. AZCC 2289]|uniref:tyrosine-type recombinase/integrase n=1 Tax=Bradyrhizobium sp. AZCC 2289 TaxID=3117026 RepID=UPI002FF38ECD